MSSDIRDELDAFRRVDGDRKEIVRQRIIRAGAKLSARIISFEEKLELAWDRVPEDEWIERLHEYEAMCDALVEIEEEVLRG